MYIHQTGKTTATRRIAVRGAIAFFRYKLGDQVRTAQLKLFGPSQHYHIEGFKDGLYDWALIMPGDACFFSSPVSFVSLSLLFLSQSSSSYFSSSDINIIYISSSENNVGRHLSPMLHI